MVLITEELIRKRAEHNEGEIFSLEELSLHQQDIKKIEYIDKWCRELKILYLQSNLISKLENLSRLKKLEYLNLALNNIEYIENLDGCESLKKLDLTVNFIGDIMSVRNLQANKNLEELYLTGNPCSQFESYKDFVISTLPQLKRLDGFDISRSERIAAVQNYKFIFEKTLQEQKDWYDKRALEKKEAIQRRELREEMKQRGEDVDEKYFSEKSSFTPESRVEDHEFLQEKRRRDTDDKQIPVQKERTLFSPDDGRPYNINELKLDFSLNDEEERNEFVLDVSVYKHLDSCLLDCDVQPNYVRVFVKGSLLQLVLPESVSPDRSTALRSQITGHLVITMPKVAELVRVPKQSPKIDKPPVPEKAASTAAKTTYLEVDPTLRSTVNLSNIITSENTKCTARLLTETKVLPAEVPPSVTFEDNPDVPPLI